MGSGSQLDDFGRPPSGGRFVFTDTGSGPYRTVVGSRNSNDDLLVRRYWDSSPSAAADRLDHARRSRKTWVYEIARRADVDVPVDLSAGRLLANVPATPKPASSDPLRAPSHPQRSQASPARFDGGRDPSRENGDWHRHETPLPPQREPTGFDRNRTREDRVNFIVGTLLLMIVLGWLFGSLVRDARESHALCVEVRMEDGMDYSEANEACYIRHDEIDRPLPGGW